MKRSALLAGLILVFSATFIGAVCGEPTPPVEETPASVPTHEFVPTAEPQWRQHLDQLNDRLRLLGYPTVNPTITDADYRELTNRARTGKGFPTLSPSLTDAEITATAAAVILTVTAGQTPLPTQGPRAPSCGPIGGSAGGEVLIAEWGSVLTDCLLVGTRQIITTAGDSDSPGAIAVLECPSWDGACLRGEPPESEATWLVYPAPAPPGTPVIITASDGTFGVKEATALTVNHGCGFTLVTYTYRCPGTWRDFVTPEP